MKLARIPGKAVQKQWSASSLWHAFLARLRILGTQPDAASKSARTAASLGWRQPRLPLRRWPAAAPIPAPSLPAPLQPASSQPELPRRLQLRRLDQLSRRQLPSVPSSLLPSASICRAGRRRQVLCWLVQLVHGVRSLDLSSTPRPVIRPALLPRAPWLLKPRLSPLLDTCARLQCSSAYCGGCTFWPRAIRAPSKGRLPTSRS